MVEMIEIGDNITLYHGDCADVLGTLPENSIDAIVTDPPAGISFMGKEWDHHKGGRAEWVTWLASIMTEATRTLKPGGHALVWALPRTSHWTATALEDAGLEIRDVITHHFATGFPKALDVSKAINAQAGAEREVVGVGRRHGGGVVGAASSYELPPTSPPITAPATLDAQKWDGWKTALKPATEHWILCRKPIAGTVAANVVQYGTGALNIDGCRIAVNGEESLGGGHNTGSVGKRHDGWKRPWMQDPEAVAASAVRSRASTARSEALGRYPSNVVWTCVCDGPHLDGCPVGELEQQSGESRSSDRPAHHQGRKSQSKGRDLPHTTLGHSDSGTAARFFYVAKAGTAEREAGLYGSRIIFVSCSLWEKEDQKAKLRVVMEPSALRVTAVSGAPNNDVSAWNTLLSGSDSTAQFRAACRSIIGTGTDSITTSAISKWFLHSCINDCTVVANFETANGGSPAQPATFFTRSANTTNEKTGSVPNAKNAQSPAWLEIRPAGKGADHPTVKAIELMRYLCRLITPHGGVILDPFMGSGSTGVAAAMEGFGFIGIEQDVEYFTTAQRRIDHESRQLRMFP